MRQTEQLRAAVLDSLAHQIKTPVATIWAASSGLLALGGLSETQTLLMGLLDEQSQKLSNIASQLINTAKLDSSTLAPRRELLVLSDVVDETIQPLERQQARSRLQISYPAEELPVLADRKLISDALGQIVNNAFKYALPETAINIGVEVARRGGFDFRQKCGAHDSPIGSRAYLRAILPGKFDRPRTARIGVGFVDREKDHGGP